MRTSRARLLQSIVYASQRFGLSAVFFYMAYRRASPMTTATPWARSGAILRAYSPLSPQGVSVLQQLTQSALIVLFDVLVGVLLLVTRRPGAPARRPVHVIVPLIATFSYLAYGHADLLPAALRELALLPDLGVPAVFASGLLITIAYLLSFAALLYLRRSFSVFVEVRRAVMIGPYRWVRHPMYLGYFLVVLALFLLQPTAANALISVVLLGLTVYRARLEEAMLVAHLPDYAAYMERTGMLFPRFWPWRRS